MDLKTELLKEILNNFFSDDIYNVITHNTLSDKITKAYNRALMKVDDENKRQALEAISNGKKPNELWKTYENDAVFSSLFADELKEDIVSYLYYIDIRLASSERKQFLLPLLNIDERINCPSSESFFKIFPHSDYLIDDLFIEPEFTVSVLENEQTIEKEVSYSEDIIQSCKDILSKQNMLFVFGPYGCGKTFLSKYLLSRITDGYSLFIYASKLPRQCDFSSTFSHEAIGYLLDKYKKLYVFFDSFESYAISDRDLVIETIHQLTEKYNNLRFIINMRKPEGVSLTSLYDTIELTLGSTEFIELKYFSNKKVKQWVTLYSLAAKELNKKVCFTYDDISRANKNLRTSCANPLLLVMMAESQTPIFNSSNQGWFDLFDVFIKKTIKGKFQLENKINQLLQGNTDKYKEFIYHIAAKIFEYSNQRLDIVEYDDPDFFLDPNRKNYSIEQEEIRNSIQSILNINADDKLTIQYLNCYFFEFECSSNTWRFKDNNVLFFLCASQICNSLFNLLDTFLKNKPIESATKRLISSYKNFPLHPVVIEFILDRITNSKQKDEIRGLIKELLNQRVIINIPQKESFVINYNKIKFDILLSIVFLRLNKHDYKSELNHYFKRVAQYYSFVKIIDKDLSSIIQRYFRNLVINNAEIRRINFKGYNWNNSSLKKVSYIQCKFQDTPMCNMVFKDVSFDLCYFNNMKFINCKGFLELKSCEIKKTTFELTNETHITFSNCILDNVWIKYETVNYPIVKLNRCDIRQFHIKCDRVFMEIKDSVLSSKIHLHSTRLIVDEENILQLGGDFSFNNMFVKDNRSSIDARELKTSSID